jgi:hypothetical protein
VICEECGFDWDATGPAEAVEMLGRLGPRYRAPLTRFLAGEDPDALLRTRPAPGVWSALEYAVHAAVAVDWYGDRVRRVLTEDRPRLPAYGFAAACDADRYNERDPAETVDAVAAACRGLVALLDGLEEGGWARVGLGSDGDERTVLVLARRAAHEAHHHLLDIGRVLRRTRGGGPRR